MKEAVHWSFHRVLKTDTLLRSHCQIFTVFLIYFIKHYIFFSCFAHRRFVQGAQRKELIITSFVKRYKAVTL